MVAVFSFWELKSGLVTISTPFVNLRRNLGFTPSPVLLSFSRQLALNRLPDKT